ncbi:ABATE domain-containing protein [Streptomyces verrucosisporus]|uniref:CGNR zinc finger domain-containing protein n=1 Tax=Streptomyces verrucosisporus TaxID=1695161 RepID=UPI0019D31528|nr:ABATE domain-containing protein [Streptomyces verrucosisporus]MBN3928186.1 ABATE domain-containing protein [Streptomyces verrucosisporus]
MGQLAHHPLGEEHGIIVGERATRFGEGAVETESGTKPRPPLSGEPLALELVNTTFVHGGLRGGPVDALTTPAELDLWLEEHAEAFPREPVRRADAPATASHLAGFRRLREALRELSRACVAQEPYGGRPVAVVNRAARLAVSWPEIGDGSESGAADGPVVRWAEPDPLMVLLGSVAVSGVELLTGPGRRDVRACAAPGCVLYFVKSHRRREWCTPACGNRVRVARHNRQRRS